MGLEVIVFNQVVSCSCSQCIIGISEYWLLFIIGGLNTVSRPGRHICGASCSFYISCLFLPHLLPERDSFQQEHLVH